MEPYELVNALLKRRTDITSVSQLAREMHNQRFQPTLHKFLAGRTRNPDRETAERIAKFFKLPVDAIYDAAVASRIARERSLAESTDKAPHQVAEPETQAEYKAQPRRALPKATLDRIAALSEAQVEALDRIVRAYLGAPNTTPNWRDVAESVAFYADDPTRKAIIDDFLRRVDRRAEQLARAAETSISPDPTPSR